MTLKLPPLNDDSKIRFFARLGHWKDVKARMVEAQTNGASATHDRTAQTVVVSWNGDTLFRALAKGDGVWLVLYNPQYYPR